MKTRRRDKGEKDMKVKLCSLFGVMGGMIAAALGGWDTALQTLIIFMVADYATGVAVAGIFHRKQRQEV
jgi:phage-related holin